MIERVDAFPLVYNEPHYPGDGTVRDTGSRRDQRRRRRLGRRGLPMSGAALATKTLVLDGFAPLVVNENPLDVERLWHKMCKHAYWYGVDGTAAFAISAIDMALWDLEGKILGHSHFGSGGSSNPCVRPIFGPTLDSELR